MCFIVNVSRKCLILLSRLMSLEYGNETYSGANLFLESPSKFSGLKSNIQVKLYTLD